MTQFLCVNSCSVLLTLALTCLSTYCAYKGIEWWHFTVDNSLVVSTFHVFSMMLVDLFIV